MAIGSVQMPGVRLDSEAMLEPGARTAVPAKANAVVVSAAMQEPVVHPRAVTVQCWHDREISEWSAIPQNWESIGTGVEPSGE